MTLTPALPPALTRPHSAFPFPAFGAVLLRAVVAASLSLAMGWAAAGPSNPQNGKDYLTLAQPQAPAADTGERIEVIEFFGYFCPHCYAFDPVIESWVKKQGDKIRFRRVHVIFRDAMIAQQALYVTLEAMGQHERLHRKIFDAMHQERLALANEQQIADFVARQGIDRQQFLAALRSPEVQARIKQLLQTQYDYGVDGVPTVAIDGRFVTSPEVLRGSIGDQPEQALHLATIQVMDHLVTRVQRERNARRALPAAVK